MKAWLSVRRLPKRLSPMAWSVTVGRKPGRETATSYPTVSRSTTRRHFVSVCVVGISVQGISKTSGHARVADIKVSVFLEASGWNGNVAFIPVRVTKSAPSSKPTRLRRLKARVAAEFRAWQHVDGARKTRLPSATPAEFRQEMRIAAVFVHPISPASSNG